MNKIFKYVLVASLSCSVVVIPIFANFVGKEKTQNTVKQKITVATSMTATTQIQKTNQEKKEIIPKKSQIPNTSSSKAVISDKTNLTELDPNHGYSEDAINFTLADPNAFTPTYEKNFGYQITHLERLYVEVEIVNTGKTTLYVNNDTLGFVLYNAGGTNVSGSQILEGEGPIAPGEKRLVKVSASHPNTSVFTVALNGRENGQTIAQGITTKFANNDPISDTIPLSVPYTSNYYIMGWETLPKDEWILTPKYNGMITGNGKMKVQALGVKILENESVEGLPEVKDSTGGYVLVQYRLVNTTNKVMTINEILLSSIYPDLEDRSKDTYLTLDSNSEIFKELGISVPKVIEPNSIVDFYLPAAYPSSDYMASITVKTSAGMFENSNVGSLMRSK